MGIRGKASRRGTMPFQTRCSHCSQMMQVADHALGETGRCPWCKHFFTMSSVEKSPFAGKREAVAEGLAAGPSRDAVSATVESSMTETAEEVQPGKRIWIEPVALAGFLASGAGLLCASMYSLTFLVP